MAATFVELVVDAHDPERLAEFWRAVLGWEPTETYEEAVELADPGGCRPTLVFVPVDDARVVKNRLHLDLRPDGCDQATELDRLVALGARRADVGQGDQPWVVLVDPEGNEFCLLDA